MKVTLGASSRGKKKVRSLHRAKLDYFMIYAVITTKWENYETPGTVGGSGEKILHFVDDSVSGAVDVEKCRQEHISRITHWGWEIVGGFFFACHKTCVVM